MKKQIYLLLIALLSYLISSAQETGSIEGNIISKDGYPLSGVSIRLGKKASVSKTDGKGRFHFENFPVGLHTITIEAEGLKKQTQDIKVVAYETTKVTFTLEEQMETLREIVIVIKESPNKRKVSAVRSGLKPMDIPQSMQTIDNEVIVQQQAIRLSEVIKNANGVYVGSARGGAQESFWSRGYDMSVNNMFKNGFRYNAGSIPEVSSLDKVEFLKGGSALLYGNVAPGGILNLVTKTPSFKKGGEVAMQTGSYAFYKPSIDLYGPLNKWIAYRLNASYENSESFRDVVKRERYYINPSFLLNLSPKTQITLQGDFMNDNWIPDFGTIIIGKQIYDVPRGKYYGAVWSNGNTKTASASALLNHSFNKNWKLNFNSSYQNYDREWKGTERIQMTNPDGTWSRPLGQYKNIEAIIGEQISLQGCFKTGTIKHQTFSGIDYENSVATANTFVFSPANYDIINVFTFNPNNQTTTEPNATNTQKVVTTTNRFGMYAQDLISFTEKFKMLAGIRWSWQEAQAETHKFTVNPVTITIGTKLKNKATSGAGAVGIWQLMPVTARSLGLRVTDKTDERRYIIQSSVAAANYLNVLYKQFDDWLLVVAAYNCGAGNVYKAIKQSGSREFWKLQRYLPAETRNHVKRFIATHYYYEGEGSFATLTKTERNKYLASLLEVEEDTNETDNTPAPSNQPLNWVLIAQHEGEMILLLRK